WEPKVERGAYSRFRFQPDRTAIRLHYFSHCREAYAAARNFASVQPLEGLKDVILITRFDTDTVVVDGEDPLIAVLTRFDVNFGRDIRPAVFDRIADQVQEHLLE